MEKKWNKNTWRNFNIRQQPKYENLTNLQEIEKKLEKLPPLIFAGEVRSLKDNLKKVAVGDAFLLQCGDCAESFSDFSANNLRDSFKVILQMSAILTYVTKL